jgi:hypothetical protein
MVGLRVVGSLVVLVDVVVGSKRWGYWELGIGNWGRLKALLARQRVGDG